MFRQVTAIILAGLWGVSAQASDLPFSKVVEANGTIYLAGHVGYDEAAKAYPQGIEAQTKQTLENIKTTLKSVNAELEDVVRCQVILVNPDDFSAMNGVYKTYFPKHPPARTTYAAKLVGKTMLIEIECTAVRGFGQTKAN